MSLNCYWSACVRENTLRMFYDPYAAILAFLQKRRTGRSSLQQILDIISIYIDVDHCRRTSGNDEALRRNLNVSSVLADRSSHILESQNMARNAASMLRLPKVSFNSLRSSRRIPRFSSGAVFPEARQIPVRSPQLPVSGCHRCRRSGVQGATGLVRRLQPHDLPVLQHELLLPLRQRGIRGLGALGQVRA
jgi:hypothetical protein